MRKRRALIGLAVAACVLLPGAADAHTGGKVSSLSWQESGNSTQFGVTVKVWNLTTSSKRVRVVVEAEGTYTVTTQVCDQYGCYDEYDFGSVRQRVGARLLVPEFGTARRRLRGHWSFPSGAELDAIYSDVVHAH